MSFDNDFSDQFLKKKAYYKILHVNSKYQQINYNST